MNVTNFVKMGAFCYCCGEMGKALGLCAFRNNGLIEMFVIKLLTYSRYPSQPVIRQHVLVNIACFHTNPPTSGKIHRNREHLLARQ